jgi:predicted AlkP superfamily phosphohydrolase/phosphomutase/Flp pilus assembly protein TadD
VAPQLTESFTRFFDAALCAAFFFVPVRCKLPPMLRSILIIVPWIALTLFAAGCSDAPEPVPEPTKVIVLGIDGLDAEVMDLMISEGLLPTFERLRRDGAHGVLWSELPMLSPILWTTMATGRTADDHGIGSFVAEHTHDDAKTPVTSSMRRVPAIWNIVSDHSRRVGVVGWWATWPPEEVNGVMVSDHTCYHLLFGQGQSGAVRTENAIFPPERATELETLIRRPQDITLDEASRYIAVAREDFDRAFEFTDDISHFRWALATADSYRAMGRRIWSTDNPDLLMVYIEGTDSVSHLFGHLFRAEGLAGELAEQQRRYGRAVEEMYVYADQMVGEFLGLLDDRTTLMVISDHGFKLGALHDDPSVTTSMRRVSADFHDLDGIIYLAGRGVRSGARITQARQIDITPTLLHLLGLPAANDMPGRILTEAFDDGREPLERIASYETGTNPRQPADDDAGVSSEVLAHLEALGYLEGDDDEAGVTRAHADMLLRGSRFDEAADAYASLVADDPEDATLHLNLSIALAQLGRHDEASAALGRAAEIDPLNPKVAYNRGVAAERRGDRDAAIENYRTTLQLDPNHGKARAALERLTGSARIYQPSNEDERRAAELAAQAGQRARQGDLEGAGELLDEAEALAPELPMVHQYRANVAYLEGDLGTAIAALERSLELEPDNARVRKNLDALRSRRDAGPD